MIGCFGNSGGETELRLSPQGTVRFVDGLAAIGCDKGSFQGRNKGESAEDTALVCSSICGKIGLPNKVMHDENPLDKASNPGCDGRPSQDLKVGQKPDEAPLLSQLALGGISSGAKEERPLDNSGNQGGGVGAVPSQLTATKCPFSDLKCTSKGLSSLDENERNMGLPTRMDFGATNVANPMDKSWSQVVNNNV
ncbi:hypothetical protein F0562_024041 [Nyssa sinensis]|uniref:Uncharacterized protein n=1 Tax=Nyssa sinensis TaxID=561372 RepID=A0A5J5BJD0_9ASTE|nr:hypothetical protein F0562_024041 [Nyssa sinensis]